MEWVKGQFSHSKNATEKFACATSVACVLWNISRALLTRPSRTLLESVCLRVCYGAFRVRYGAFRVRN